MSSYDDSNLFDDWLDMSSNSPMLSFVNPSDICPLEIQHQQQHQHQQQQQPQTTYQTNKPLVDYKPQLDQIHYIGYTPPQPLTQQQHNQNQQQYHNNQDPNFITVQDITNQQLGPPPVLVPKDGQKFYCIQQQLEFHRALSQQRQEQLRARLDNEPPKLPPRIMKKTSGKKMTGRERQLELERTEERLLRQRDHFVDLITKLEAKCNRLREILGSIVTNSPEYNNQMISCLEADGLLIDSHIN